MGHSLGAKTLMTLCSQFKDLHSFINGVIIVDMLPINYFNIQELRPGFDKT
jgi:hypothetical protein